MKINQIRAPFFGFFTGSVAMLAAWIFPLIAWLPGRGNEPVRPAPVSTYTVSSIVEFEWIKGNYEWVQPSRQRLLQSQLVFNKDGSFVYVLPYDTYTTYYLSGAWYLNDSGERIFEGSTATSNGAGSGTKILINGKMYKYGSETRAVISYASGANYYAKVNGTEFSNNVSKQFNAKVVLR